MYVHHDVHHNVRHDVHHHFHQDAPGPRLGLEASQGRKDRIGSLAKYESPAAPPARLEAQQAVHRSLTGNLRLDMIKKYQNNITLNIIYDRK